METVMRQILLPESDILKSWHRELAWRLLRLFLLLTEQQKTWKIWQSKPKSNAQLPENHRKYLWSTSSEVKATKSEGNKWHNLSMTTMQICLCTALFTFTHCIQPNWFQIFACASRTKKGIYATILCYM